MNDCYDPERTIDELEKENSELKKQRDKAEISNENAIYLNHKNAVKVIELQQKCQAYEKGLKELKELSNDVWMGMAHIVEPQIEILRRFKELAYRQEEVNSLLNKIDKLKALFGTDSEMFVTKVTKNLGKRERAIISKGIKDCLEFGTQNPSVQKKQENKE